MTPTAHIKTAREFLEASDREFEAGDELQGSEKLWGAATHALRAAAQPGGQSIGKHRELSAAAKQLALERDDPAIQSGFAIAEKFHANFYHGFMEDYEIESARPIVRNFVERILLDRPPIARESPSPGRGR
jgi:hypothetical protein